MSKDNFIKSRLRLVTFSIFPIFIICSLYLLPSINIGKEFNIKKSSNLLKDKNKIEYSIEYSKEGFNEVLNPYITDRIDNDLSLTSLSKLLPSSYKLNGKDYDGTPLKDDYKETSSLQWNIKSFDSEEEKRLRYNQTYPNFDFAYNISFRTDLLYFPSSKIYKKLTISNFSIGNTAPILELVEGEIRLFLGSTDGRLLCVDPRSWRIYWEHNFPLGEGVNTPFVSFREEIGKDDSWSNIAVLTEAGKLYLFDCFDGSVRWSKKLIEGAPKGRALIKILEYSNKNIISITLDDQLFLINPKNGEEILKPKLPFNTSSLIIFPLKNKPIIICASSEGIIQCFSIDGSILWGKTLNGRINYEGTLAMFDGTLYLLYATSSKALYVINGLTGNTIDIFTIPGHPRSSVSFDPGTLSYFLVTSNDLNDSKESILYGGSLLKDIPLIETKVIIDGKYFIGPVGLRIKDETILYFVNENGKLYAIQKGAKKPVSNYPISLVSANEVSKVDSLEGYISITEGALFITSNNFGFVTIGTPFSNSKKSYLSSFSYLSSDDLSYKSDNYSGARYRNDLDSLPNTKINLKKSLNISPYDNSGHILTPITYFDKLTGELRIASTTANGKLILMNEDGEEIKSLDPKLGPIYTEPIIMFDKNMDLEAYIIGLNGVVSIQKSAKIKEKWRREDIGSFGSSTYIYKFSSFESLIFVDKLNYLTSLNTLNGETMFREKVDCRDFAVGEIDGEKYLFCGSKMIEIKSGRVIKNTFTKNSSSTTAGINGKLLLFQSDDLDMLCIDPKNDEVIWRVRKLWCKKYCFDGQSSAILRKGSWALSFWCDYTRIVCIDVNTGLIRWRFTANDDYFVSKPTVVETLDGFYVFVGSINGKVYAFDCLTGKSLPNYPIQLPGKPVDLEVLKGASSPVLINGLMLINRVEYGIIGIGNAKESNRLSIPVNFTVEIKENRRGKVIFNQAILYWNQKYKKSNIVKN